jgi:deoxyribonuclease IV
MGPAGPVEPGRSLLELSLRRVRLMRETCGWMPIIGAHVDSRHGLHNAFPRARELGAEAIQVHPTPAKFWGSPKLDDERVGLFREAAEAAGHPPFYFHAVYLINLAGDDPVLRQRSESTLAGYLAAADRLGISGVIFHTGSHKGAGFEACLPVITDHLKRVMERAAPATARLLIENNAGTGGCVGARFEELRAMLDAVDDPRVGVCFDTCHAFASGYDVRTAETVVSTLDEWERVVGMERLEVVHTNDSQTGLGSNRDRHANIGQGEIGEEGFRVLLHDARLRDIPFILEVPGADGTGPDAANVETLRRLAAP